jgi:hypothetical protein
MRFSKARTSTGQAVLRLLSVALFSLVLLSGIEAAPGVRAEGDQQQEPPIAPVRAGRATSTDVLVNGYVSVSDSNPGAGVEFSVQVSPYNNSDFAGTGIQVKVALPAGVTPTATPPAASSGTYDAGTGTWSFDIGAFEQLTLTLYLQTTLGAKTISAEVIAEPAGDPNSTPGNCPAPPAAATENDCQHVSLVGADPATADASLAITAPGFANFVRGGYAIFQVTLRNEGPATLSGIVVRMTIPVGYTFEAVDSGAYDSGTGNWTPGDLGNDGVDKITLTLRAETPGAAVFVAELISAIEPDPDSTPNDASGDDYAPQPATIVANEPNAIRVGSIPNRRFNQSWTLDGPQMGTTRAKLLNLANFGAAGIVSRPVQLFDLRWEIGQVTVAELQALDILIIGYYNDSNANKFTAAELQAMRQWVANGGRIIISCDSSDYDEVCRAFANPTGSTQSINPMLVPPSAQTHPVFSGPFGSMTEFSTSGTHTVFTSPAGSDVLATETGTPGATMLQARDVGCGLAVMFADIDIIANVLSGGAAITNNNDKLLGNMVAWMGNAPQRPGCDSFPTRAGATGQLWYGINYLKADLDSAMPLAVTAIFEWDNPGQAFKFWFRGFPDNFNTLVGVSQGGFYFFQATGVTNITMQPGAYTPPPPAVFDTVAGARGQLWTGAPKLGPGGAGGISSLPAVISAVFLWDNPAQSFKFWFRGFPDGFQTLTNVQSYRYYFFQSANAGTPVTP